MPSQASKPKGEKKAKAAAPSHPVYSAMIKAAIKDLKDRKGASKQAISKFIMQKYKLGDNEKQVRFFPFFPLESRFLENFFLDQCPSSHGP